MNPAFFRFRNFLALFILVFSGCLLLQAQDSKPSSSAQPGDSSASAQNSKDSSTQNQDPLKRHLKEKQKEAGLKEKEGKIYKKWLDEDVRWIITEEELAAFKKLGTNAERDQFIENFWARRDPTPDTPENEFKEEHYRRIAYADDHFASGVPGWKTDRGRIYIIYGKPDEIESHPMGGPYQRPDDEGGGMTTTFPFEVWTYRFIEGIGQDVHIEFVDQCGCNEYHMTMDRGEKDALLNVPNAGLTELESMGMANKADRFGRGIERIGQGLFDTANNNEFDRLGTFAKLNSQPQIKFKDLNEIVTSRLQYKFMPFDVRVDFVKVTSDTALMPITIQVPISAITFENKDGVMRGTVNVLGKLSKLTGQPVQTFETPLQEDIPADLLPRMSKSVALYWKALPMRPGLYRLDVVVKDVNGGKLGTFSRSYTVPDFSDDKLSSSSLILADEVEPVPAREIGTGEFVIGTTKVRPRVQPSNGKPVTFKRDQDLKFWMQVYNLSPDEKTRRPDATVEYQIVNTATNQSVVDLTESTAQMGNVGEQITLAKSVPLAKFQPGVYQVTVKVNDQVSKQVIAPSVKFAVE